MARSYLRAAVAIVVLVLFVRPTVWAADSQADDSLVVPKGGPVEMVDFIKGLEKQKPQDAESAEKIHAAALKAAERILASRPNEEQLLFAVQTKAALLQDSQELAAFEAKLKKTGHKVAAQAVHLRLLLAQLQQAPSDTAFLQQVAELKKYMAAGPLHPGDEQVALQAAEIAERKGKSHLAGETYESMAKLLAADPKFARLVQQMQARARRLKLVGNTMRVEGKTLDGRALDWDKYRGKVVLIDFWATWCGPCRAEIPNIKASYEKYHGQGFDVIGISIDQMSSQEVAVFVQKEEVPWPICRDGDSPQSMSDYYGIQAIPEMILVGRDGKVVALGVRGAALEPLVEKSLSASANVAAGAGGGDRAKLKKDREQKKADELAAQKKRRELAVTARVVQARTWTDATGKFQVTAKFRGMANDVVKLETEDGKVISLALDKLSEDDQQCIRERKY